MTPTIALAALLTIVAMRPFFELPDIAARTRALEAGGYKRDAGRSCMSLLLIPIMLGLWWYYALTTDQVLLAVIPTVGAAVSILAVAIERAASTNGATR